MKKKRVLLILGLFMALVIYGLLSYFPFSPLSKRIPVNALPFDTPYFIQFNHFPDASGSAAKNSPNFNNTTYWAGVLDYLDILLIEDRLKALAWPAGWAASDRQLFIYDMQGTRLPVDEWKEKGEEPSRYKGFSIYHLKGPDGKVLALTQYKNLLLISQQALLIEDALRQLTAHNMEDSPTLNLKRNWLKQKKEHSPIFLFQFPYIESFFQQNNTQGLSHFSSFQPDWLQLEWLTPGENPAILAANIQWAPDSTPFPKTKRSGLRMARVLDIIPSWTTNWEAIQLDDLSATYRQISRGETDWFSRYITPWAGDHLAWLDLTAVKGKSSLCWLVPYRDTLLATQSLNALLAEAGELSRVSYQSYELVQGNVDNLFSQWQKETQSSIQNPWWTKLGGYYIFSAEKQGLQQLIDAYLVGQTLLQLELPEHFISLNSQWLRVLPSPSQWQFGPLQQGHSVWLNGRPTAYGMELSGFVHPGNPQNSFYPTIAWRSALTSDVEGPPSLIKTGTGEWAIFVSDKNNYLYKLDQQGDIKWQQKLSNPLLSDVQALHNESLGAMTLIFNTAKQLYQIDLEGQPQMPFPLSLDPPATNGLLAVDFQKEGVYQFFLACSGGIFAFSDEGVPLRSWNPLPVNGQFRQAIQHIQNKTNDYLIGWNTAGVLYNWKRSSELHFPPVQLHPTNNLLSIESNGRQQRIVAVDSSGLAQVVNLKGESFNLPLSVGNNREVKFAFGNFTGDVRNDFAVLSGRNLVLHYYSEKGFEQKYSHQLDRAPDQLFPVVRGEGELALLGSLNVESQEIGLYDEEGRLLPGFPLGGNTPFSLVPLEEEGHYLLVVGQEEWVIAYRVIIR